MQIILIIMLLYLTQSNASSRSKTDVKFCVNLEPVLEFDVSSILGMYFVKEIIYHHRKTAKTEISPQCFHGFIRKPEDAVLDMRTYLTTSSYYAQTTPLPYYRPLNAGSAVPEHRYGHLVVEWDEPGNLLEYQVKFNTSRRGFWMSAAPKNDGRLAHIYKHFVGTIQVLKAAHDRLVLTFCQRLPEPKLFSVLFSRRPDRLDDLELIGIHSMLSRRHLSTSSVKKVCNGAGALVGYLTNYLLFVKAFVTIWNY